MKPYDKILIRTSLDEGGEVPRTGDLSDSPDVIPYGTTKVEDPVSFFLDNYDDNVNADLKATEVNYIYIRGKDLVRGVQKGDMYVYYALDAELDMPASWANNKLKTSSGKNFVSVLGQNKDDILVGAEPFVWTVPNPPTGVTYSLIGIVVPAGTVPDFSGVTDFEAFVADNVNVGWTKVTIKTPPPPPIPKLRWQTTFNYKQGDVARTMTFDIGWNGIPIGTYVSFKAEKEEGPVPPIFLDKTKVVETKAHFSIDSDVPAGYESNITFYFYCDNAPAAGSTVTLKAYYLTGESPQKPVTVASVTTAN
ncbi:hypothetical protein [Mucilaginibacter gotjawali]|uniref:Uncharacterized protein n=2 Tax=Mucilaginibacter gotjawali TaxID=1550579 RepID=A0A839S6P3_9SPHI|nr:hypothetical protein [Mucilaginibacter gotjawali]MBB3053761.1 hypothetical protein [Mucilaginibacter gotjawali]BAU54022.1 hypothetical protein MgSA37_02193 [Mucilaginibacter gotjawali]